MPGLWAEGSSWSAAEPARGTPRVACRGQEPPGGCRRLLPLVLARHHGSAMPALPTHRRDESFSACREDAAVGGTDALVLQDVLTAARRVRGSRGAERETSGHQQHARCPRRLPGLCRHGACADSTGVASGAPRFAEHPRWRHPHLCGNVLFRKAKKRSAKVVSGLLAPAPRVTLPPMVNALMGSPASSLAATRWIRAPLP